jgi:hypothetical protein
MLLGGKWNRLLLAYPQMTFPETTYNWLNGKVIRMMKLRGTGIRMCWNVLWIFKKIIIVGILQSKEMDGLERNSVENFFF